MGFGNRQEISVFLYIISANQSLIHSPLIRHCQFSPKVEGVLIRALESRPIKSGIIKMQVLATDINAERIIAQLKSLSLLQFK